MAKRDEKLLLASKRIHIHTCIHTYIQPYIHIYIHTYIHTTIHTCIHAIYLLICAHTQTWWSSDQPLASITLIWALSLTYMDGTERRHLRGSLSLSLSLFLSLSLSHSLFLLFPTPTIVASPLLYLYIYLFSLSLSLPYLVGLTAIYHCAMRGCNVRCVELLLKVRVSIDF